MSARTPEGRITETIIKNLNKLRNVHAHKVHGGPYGSNGEPDIDAVFAGHSVRLEVKQPSNRKGLTPNQRLRLRQWRAVGATCAVVTSWPETVAVLTALHAHTDLDAEAPAPDVQAQALRDCIDWWA